MNITRVSSRALTLAVTLSLCACVVGPTYRRPPAAQPGRYAESEGWRPIEPRPAASDTAWWTIFNDPTLNDLESQVAESNQSLKAAEASHRQAVAIVSESRAGYGPVLGVDASGERAQSPGLQQSPTGSTTTTPATTLPSFGAGLRNQFDLAASASWVPDFWGRVHRTVESSVASAQASAADLASARLSLQATLATDYFQLRIDDELKRLYERTVEGYQRSLEIVRNQFQFGTAAQADVISAETQLEGAQAQLIGVGVQRAEMQHAIAVLIGKTADELSIQPVTLRREVPVVPPGVPSTLLERRPDIAAAERATAAASAQIGVAIAAYFPDITLSASLGFVGSEVHDLLSAANKLWSVGVAGSETIFDRGLRHAQVAAARAVYDENVATYRQTVLTAFSQVEDQLASLRIFEQQSQMQERTVESARQAVQLTLNQYEAGTVAYTSVVTTQAIALNDEQALLNTLGSRLGASVALIAALGGGWDSGMLADSASRP